MTIRHALAGFLFSGLVTVSCSGDDTSGGGTTGPGAGSGGNATTTSSGSSSEGGGGAASTTTGSGGMASTSSGAGGAGGSALPCTGIGTCGKCLTGKCCPELQGCQGDDACKPQTSCVLACDGPDFAACVDACAPMPANAAFDTYAACAKTECSADCSQ